MFMSRPASLLPFVTRLVPNVGADWREGEGYGECLEEAAVAPPRVRERRR